jgi:hypothetical protein
MQASAQVMSGTRMTATLIVFGFLVAMIVGLI